MIRCKFKCHMKTIVEGGASIELSAVHSGSPENEKFFKYTPAAKLTLSLIDLEQSKKFIPGKEYYIDISEVKETN